MNKVYIIIVNHKKYKDTIECLESVFKNKYNNFQVFLIDNSPDETSSFFLVKWLNNNYGEVKTLYSDLVYPLINKPLTYITIGENKFKDIDAVYDQSLVLIKAENRGFAAANNIALSYIKKSGDDASLVWVLNNDTVIEKNALYNLVVFYRNNSEKKYLLSTKLRYYHNPNIIQAIAGSYNHWLGKHRHIGEGEEDFGQYNNYKYGKRDYIVGASLFFPKLFIEQAGLMCEDYFLYFEELDWMLTGIKYGYKAAIVPNAVVYHKEGSSIITGSEKLKKDLSVADYYSIINRVRFIKKWYPFALITVMIGVSFALIKRACQGKFGLVKKASISIIKILFTNS